MVGLRGTLSDLEKGQELTATLLAAWQGACCPGWPSPGGGMDSGG